MLPPTGCPPGHTENPELAPRCPRLQPSLCSQLKPPGWGFPEMSAWASHGPTALLRHLLGTPPSPAELVQKNSSPSGKENQLPPLWGSLHPPRPQDPRRHPVLVSPLHSPTADFQSLFSSFLHAWMSAAARSEPIHCQQPAGPLTWKPRHCSDRKPSSPALSSCLLLGSPQPVPTELPPQASSPPPAQPPLPRTGFSAVLYCTQPQAILCQGGWVSGPC